MDKFVRWLIGPYRELQEAANKTTGRVRGYGTSRTIADSY